MRYCLPILCAISLTASGCGTYVPELDPLNTQPGNWANFINTVALNVKCQLRNAVLHEEAGVDAAWMRKWAAEVTLTLNITEKTGVAASATTSELFPSVVRKFVNGTSVTTPQSFVFGFGGGYTQTAGRIVAMTWYDDFKEFEGAPDTCATVDGVRLDGDLKIEEIIFAAAWGGTNRGSMSRMNNPNGPYQNVQQTVTFDIEASANATPTWHYVNVAVMPTGTLLNVDRDRKDQLLITLGPPAAKAKGSSIGSNDVSTIHNLSRIVSPLQ